MNSVDKSMTKISNNGLLRLILLISIGTSAFVSLPTHAAEFCSDTYYIDETFPNGSRWDMCWEHRNREGIVFHHVFYTPKNGVRQQVLYQASIAQIHVPYDDNGARYHDVSDYGIGGGYMRNLSSGECPNGTLINYSGKNAICKQIQNRHLDFYTESETVQGQALSLFSVAKIGAYHYIPQWKFYDNGTIEPSMGATGALQRYKSGHSNRGWPMDPDRTGIAHLHNYFWRLDFDLGSSGTNDFVEEQNYILRSGKRERETTKFNTEQAREINQQTLRTWRVVDGGSSNENQHPRSYEILLKETGHKDVGPNEEPYTHNDFFVTQANSCEKYASHNPTSNGCARNLAQFVNGQTLQGKDIIAWVGLTFYHMPRVEDAPHMDAHWNHFYITPRDWHASNPLGTIPVNNAPDIINPGEQNSFSGDPVNLQISASDAENDSLTYSASNLPSGLTINSQTGLISGTIDASIEGNFNVSVSVSDGTNSSNTNFTWKVSTPNSGNIIQIDGNDADWNNLPVYYDTAGENTSPVDIESMQVTGDTNNLYISYRNRQSINQDLAWAWQVIIDTDNNAATGFKYFGLDMGGDHLLLGNSLYRYNGNGDNWDWQFIRTVESSFNESFAEFSINRSDIGSLNRFKLTFYGANTYANGDLDDLMFVNITDLSNTSNINQSPVITFPGEQINVAGESVNLQISATDSENDPLTFTASNLPSGLSINRSNGLISGIISSSVAGDFPVSLIVSDGSNNSMTNFNWQVTANSPTGIINIDGVDTDWTSVPVYQDTAGENTSPVDVETMQITGDSENIYISYHDRQSIDPDNRWAWQVIIDSDYDSSTGFKYLGISMGGDHLLLGNSLYEYTGTGNDWNWRFIRTVDAGFNGNFAEFSIKRSDIGQSNRFKLTFYGANTFLGGQPDDLFFIVIPDISGGNTNNGVIIDGNDSDWPISESISDDPNENTTPVDFTRAWFKQDNDYAYFAYQNRINIDRSKYWAWLILIDSDLSVSTGYNYLNNIGANYMLLGNSVYQYAGNGSDWNWTYMREADGMVNGTFAEIAIKKTDLGNSDRFKLVFFGSNTFAGGNVDDSLVVTP